MVSWASRYPAPSCGHDGESWSGVVEGKALEEGGVALPHDGGGPRPFLRMEGRIEASRRGQQRSTGTQPDDRRTDTGSSETMPSAGAELRTTRRRGHRPGSVRCSRWGGTAWEFRIVIAKAIGMKYLGSPSPAGGPRDLGVLVRNVRCAANIAKFSNVCYKRYICCAAKIGLNGDA